MSGEMNTYLNFMEGFYPDRKKISLREKGPVTVQLLDIEGNRIPYYEKLHGRSEYAVRLDTRSLQCGVYFLQAKTGKEVETVRVVVR